MQSAIDIDDLAVHPAAIETPQPVLETLAQRRNETMLERRTVLAASSKNGRPSLMASKRRPASASASSAPSSASSNEEPPLHHSQSRQKQQQQQHQQQQSRQKPFLSLMEATILLSVFFTFQFSTSFYFHHHNTSCGSFGQRRTVNQVVNPTNAKEFFLQSFLMSTRTSMTDRQWRGAPSVDDDRRPEFILHVGLPKTGTALLQCALCSNPHLTEPLLQADNFVYLGTCPWKACAAGGAGVAASILQQQAQNQSQTQQQSTTQFYLSHRHASFFLDADGPNVRQWDGLLHAGPPEKGDFIVPGPILHDQLMTDSKFKLAYKNIPQLHPHLLEKVERLRQLNSNVLVVFEGAHLWSARHIRALAAYLNPNFRVRVVIGATPVFDWITTKYHTYYSASSTPPLRQWPGLPLDTRPKEKGVELPPFNLADLLMDETTSSPKPMTHFGNWTKMLLEDYHMHPARLIQYNYQFQFANVDIVSLPYPATPERLLEHWLCRVLSLPAACETLHKETETKAVAANKRLPVLANDGIGDNHLLRHAQYDTLAVEAHERGLFTTTTRETPKGRVTHPNRKQVVHSMMEWHKKQHPPHTVPLKCPSDAALDRMRELSWELENDIDSTVPLDQESDRLQRHDERFRATMQLNFCQVDTHAALASTVWKEFFAKLNHQEQVHHVLTPGLPVEDRRRKDSPDVDDVEESGDQEGYEFDDDRPSPEI